ncbi:MAG: IS256 family transposase [Actinomycetota bacterium]
MEKVQRIPVGRKPGERKIELPQQVNVELGDLAGKVKEGLLAFAVGVGLEVFNTLLEEDRTEIVGPKGKHDPAGRSANRHGSQPSSVTLGGRKVDMQRPRVRSVTGEELALPAWQALASNDDLLEEMALGRMLAGLSTRNYGEGLEPVGSDLEVSSVSKSAISRRFVARTKVALDELLAKDLSDLKICALFADGIEMADHLMVCVIGLDRDGNKHVLGIREGTTENATVCAALFSGLVERGLDASDGILVVIDGGKGLRAAVRRVFGNLGLVQRCRLHKRRNVTQHLPKNQHPTVIKKMEKAYAKPDPDKALAALKALATKLEISHPGAAASLREGLDETLTVNRLGVPGSLLPTLSNTNVIESSYSIARTTMRNVKRWRSGKMVERWTAAGMEVAAARFRRVKGYRELPVLVESLKAEVAKLSQGEDRIPA